jgi:N-methylhydantoinase A/oxoprolinase/acetone carboxylase beta subunit
VNNPTVHVLGIDTGGTYTDAVILDQRSHTITAAAKAITTKGDLSIGIREAMEKVLRNSGTPPQSISLIAISTTLATNAVVESHGSPAAAVLIGFDDAMATKTGLATAFPGMPMTRIAGGHNHNGEEAAKLDIEALRSFCATHKQNVSAFAVASAFAVRNSDHENRARKIIIEATGKPVTCSTDLATALDAPRRALTAVLNARLISRVTDLLMAVRTAAQELQLQCPLMIVRGDGTLASGQLVAERPIETILSGPAASLIGARWLSGRSDFIMSDIGGTTTDIGIFTDNRPRIAADGAQVGGWRTMVQAIDVTTIGLGGDSEVHIGLNGKLELGPARALPVSLLASRRPETINLLEADLAETEGGSLLGKFVVLPFGAKTPSSQPVTDREREILSMLSDAPAPLRKVAVSSAAQRAVQSLRRKGLIQYSTFTPSDACHVLGKQANWSRKAAELAAQSSVRFRTMKAATPEQVEAFSAEVWSLTVERSCYAILDAATGGQIQTVNDRLVRTVCDGSKKLGLTRVALSPTAPIIAVGGPAKVFYDEVGSRLDCEVIFTNFCDVANAVGAAAGTIQSRVKVSVEGDGSGLFRVFADGKSEQFTSGKMALSKAIQLAREAALREVKNQGASNPRVDHHVEQSRLPDATDEEGLLSAVVTAESSGLPYG